VDAVGDVYLIRHGETEWSAAHRHTSYTDLELTADGERQAAALAPALAGHRFVAVLASPRKRALRTAELAGLAVTDVDDRLVEWDYGEYEGRTTSEIRTEQPGWSIWERGAPGGETPEQVTKRADDLIADVAGTLADGDVVMVGHGHFSRALMARWIGLPVVEGARFMLDAPAWAVLGHYHGDVRCLDHVNLHSLG
jgi:probable phosphoglycerate mutase